MKLRYYLRYLTRLLTGTIAPPYLGDKFKVKEIHRQEIIESGVVIDEDGGWINNGLPTELSITGAVKNICIQNCKIRGSIRISGLGRNGEAPGVRMSSLSLGHTERCQAAAPSHITIRNVEFDAVGIIPLYLSPGVTHVNIENCLFSGAINSVMLYLDAESGYNTIQNNTFNPQSTHSFRELVAVDGSAHNIIENNDFVDVPHGGIYVYRNCGEGGTVRHQEPKFNIIRNNVFDLTDMSFWSQGVWLGSRKQCKPYCHHDDGYSFGSSINNNDFADENTVTGNRFKGHRNKVKDWGKGNKITK